MLFLPFTKMIHKKRKKEKTFRKGKYPLWLFTQGEAEIKKTYILISQAKKTCNVRHVGFNIKYKKIQNEFYIWSFWQWLNALPIKMQKVEIEWRHGQWDKHAKNCLIWMGNRHAKFFFLLLKEANLQIRNKRI